MKQISQYLQRLKNPATVLGIASYILMLLTESGIEINNEHIMNIIKCIAGILVLLGIMNNPDTSGMDLPMKKEKKK